MVWRTRIAVEGAKFLYVCELIAGNPQRAAGILIIGGMNAGREALFTWHLWLVQTFV